MDATAKLCEGCLRTLDEIAAWGGMNDREKLSVMELVARRKSALEPPSTRDVGAL
jgi:uncharacterized protein